MSFRKPGRTIAQAVLVLAALHFGVSVRCHSQEDVANSNSDCATREGFACSRGSSEKSNAPGVDQGGMTIFVTLPLVESGDPPVAAILSDTNHFVGDFAEAFANRPLNYQGRIEPEVALWGDGSILWRSKNGQYYLGCVNAGPVEAFLSSIRAEDFNTESNARYTHSGRHLVEEYFKIAFVSRGRTESVILCSPFHFWRHRKYTYWSESTDSLKSYPVEKCSWGQFRASVPVSFLAFLGSFDRLQSALLALQPDVADSKRIDLSKTVKQVTYCYRFENGAWVRMERSPSSNDPLWEEWTGYMDKVLDQEEGKTKERRSGLDLELKTRDK